MGSESGSSTLKVIVHRGTDQVGASCIEVASPTTRVILDCGWPLTSEPVLAPPPVPGVFEDGPSPNALLLTHAHPDHTGFVEAVKPDIPIFATAETSKMMLVGSCYARGIRLPRERFHEVPVPNDSNACTSFRIGDMEITAYPVDHSAYGAVAYLVEAGGKRIFYTGDLRFHGRKPGMHRRIERELAGKLDLLITEGTNFGRKSTGLHSENEVEETATQLIRHCPALAIVSFSPQNLDRFVSYFGAAQRAGRIFVCDHYLAAVLYMVNRRTLPRIGERDGLRVYFSHRRTRIEKFERHSRAAAISLDQILTEPRRYVMLVRPSMLRHDFEGRTPRESCLLYGMWSGYRKTAEWMQVERYLSASNSTLHECHTSGHAHSTDLLQFSRRLGPKRMLPVHTSAPDAFNEVGCERVRVQDGECFVV